MAQYYFHLHECGHIVIDEDGVDRIDLAAARSAAIDAARDIMSGEVREGNLCMSCHIDVRDEHDVPVMVVRFSDALTVTEVV